MKTPPTVLASEDCLVSLCYAFWEIFGATIPSVEVCRLQRLVTTCHANVRPFVYDVALL